MYYYMGKSLGPPPTELELIHSLSYLSCCWPAATTLSILQWNVLEQYN